MNGRDARVDAYIERAAPFARPILAHLRGAVHAALPEARETIKWGMPFFELNKPLCMMAAFKAHCAFGFWKGVEVTGVASDAAMGQLGRITALADLPPKKTLVAWVRKAAALQREAALAKVPAARKPPRPVEVPPALTKALRSNAPARRAFEAFSPTNRRDYAEWIAEAKTKVTRERRLAQALEWLSEGKPRNWKYMAKAKAATPATPSR